VDAAGASDSAFGGGAAGQDATAAAEQSGSDFIDQIAVDQVPRFIALAPVFSRRTRADHEGTADFNA